MVTPETRIEALEAQVNALAQAFLRLAAAAEMSGAIERQPLCQALRGIRWPGSSLEPGARSTLSWLADELDAAHAARQSVEQPA